MVKEIELTQDKVALVDDSDYEKLNNVKWHAHCQLKKNNRQTCYAERVTIDPTSKKRTTHHMHRVIMKPSSNQVVDHINGDGLDNRKENLRVVTNRVNLLNRHHEKSSKYPGLCWDKSLNTWKIHLTVNGKQKYIGCGKDEDKAFEKYKKAVKKYHGEGLIPELQ